MDIKAFKGLNNVTDPLRAGMGFLARADNVDITDTGALVKRQGFTRMSSTPTSAGYATRDQQRMYLVENGTLRSMEGAVIATGLGTVPMFWTEVNGDVFYNDGQSSGIIKPDNTLLAWRWAAPDAPVITKSTGTLDPGTYRVRVTTLLDDGREAGTSETSEVEIVQGEAFMVTGLAPDTAVYIAHANSTVFRLAGYPRNGTLFWSYPEDMLGADLNTSFFDPLPISATTIQHWKGRIYAAQYMPTENQTVIWFSEPLAYHLFNLNSNFFMVPGKATMLAPHQDALIVGTDAAVYAYNAETLVRLAEYGVVEGEHWVLEATSKEHPERLLFWSVRGVCAALPFTNLTERQVSVAPGKYASGALILDQGQKRYLVTIHQHGPAENFA